MWIFDIGSEESVVREAMETSLSEDGSKQCVFVLNIEQKRRMMSIARSLPCDWSNAFQEFVHRNESALIFENGSVLYFIVASENSKGRKFHTIYASDDIPEKVVREILIGTEIYFRESEICRCETPDECHLEITFDDLINGVYEDTKSK